MHKGLIILYLKNCFNLHLAYMFQVNKTSHIHINRKALWLCTIFMVLFSACKQRSGLSTPQTSYCGCKEVSYSFLSCDTTYITSKTILFWQWNCDSSWLTLQQKGKAQTILDVLEREKMPKSSSIGMHYIKKIGPSLWLKKQEVSGCCYPPTHSFFNLKRMKESFHIDKKLFVWENLDLNYLVHFEDTSYQTLVLYNPKENKKYIAQNKVKDIAYTLANGNIPFVKELFERPKVTKDSIKFTYSYLNHKNQWLKEVISIKK